MSCEDVLNNAQHVLNGVQHGLATRQKHTAHLGTPFILKMELDQAIPFKVKDQFIVLIYAFRKKGIGLGKVH